MGQQQYLLSYNAGYCDMVSSYNDIKAIGDRAVQELPGTISFGDVGNVDVKTTHGIYWMYWMKLPLFNGNNSVFSGVYLDHITVQVFIARKSWKGYQNLSKLPRHASGNTGLS